jgi:hypothetical protein
MLREGNLESAVGDVIAGKAESGANRQVGRTQEADGTGRLDPGKTDQASSAEET